MRLFRLLQRLDKRELNQFQLYLKTPIFNRREDVKLLLNAWLAENGRSHPNLFYWERVFPDSVYAEKKWNLLKSRLFKLLESFLAFREIQKSDSLQKFYLAKAYRKLHEEKNFTRAIFETKKALEKQPFRSGEYLQGLYDLSYEQYDYISSTNRKQDNNLQEVINNLDHYFIVAKLKQACNALSRSLINQEEYQVGMIEEMLRHIESQPLLLEVPGISMYYHCYQAITASENEEAFSRLRTTIRKHQDYFPPAELRDIYTFAINFSIRKSNKGSLFFIRETFELYVLSLERGFLLEDGIMLESTYSNIVSLALRLKKFEWAEHFLQEYQRHLKPNLQSSFYHFNLGKVYYQKRQLQESLLELVKVEPVSSFLHLAARILQLKIYYELEEIDPLESLLESLRVYLQRSKDLAYRKEHYSNILTFTKQLLQLPAMSKTEKLAFRKRVETAEVLGERDWFLNMIDK